MSATQEVGEIFGAGAGPAHAMLRSPTVLIASIGLWGMNVYFFKVFHIDYRKVLLHDLRKLNELHHSHHHHYNKDLLSSEHSSANDDEELTIMDASSLDNSSNNNIGSSNSSNNNSNSASHDDVGAGQLACLSVTLLLLLHITYLIWIDWMGGGTIGAIFAFYGAVTTAILFPLSSTKWLRSASVVVLHRCLELLRPRFQTTCHDGTNTSKWLPRPIPFIDVFFADAMCSLSKVFFDWGMMLHMASYYPQPVPANGMNILVPSLCAAVPFLIRTRQCLVMWTYCRLKNDPHMYQHLWNALKYVTSVVPLIVSAYQKTIPKARAAELDIYLILLLVINASYGLWWDVVRDWGMMTSPGAMHVLCNPTSTGGYGLVYASPAPVPRTSSGSAVMFATGGGGGAGTTGVGSHLSSSSSTNINISSGSNNNSAKNCWYALLRARLRFGVSISVLILVTDAVLRFSWILRFFHTIFPSNDSFVLCTQFLEVFRRAIWNLLRVEWENLKQSGHHHSHSSLLAKASPATMQLAGLPSAEEGQFLLVQRSNKEYANKITSQKNAEA